MAACIALLFLLIPAGRIGDVYPRVTTPRQASLVIGTSRAAQDVNPEILNSELKDLYDSPLYNFAFHLDASAYNEVYLQAIEKKLVRHDGSRNLFILAVDPWALRQLDSVPDELRLRSVSSRPNWEYLVKNFSRLWFSPLPTYSFVNAHGRTDVDYVPKSKAEWEQRVKLRLKAYDGMAKNYSYGTSEQRVFERLTCMLLKRGDVFLVRVPVSQPMLSLENKCCPDFNSRMNNLAEKYGVPYFDFTAEHYDTTDGNHLTNAEGNRFSRELAHRIRHACDDARSYDKH